MTENTYEPASEAQRKRLIPSLEKYLAWERMHGASQTQPADGSRHVVELAIVELQRLTAENERLRGLLTIAGCNMPGCVQGAYPSGPDGEATQCQFCYERDELLTAGDTADG